MAKKPKRIKRKRHDQIMIKQRAVTTNAPKAESERIYSEAFETVKAEVTAKPITSRARAEWCVNTVTREYEKRLKDAGYTVEVVTIKNEASLSRMEAWRLAYVMAEVR
jgi:hypothetical protein